MPAKKRLHSRPRSNSPTKKRQKTAVVPAGTSSSRAVPISPTVSTESNDTDLSRDKSVDESCDPLGPPMSEDSDYKASQDDKEWKVTIVTFVSINRM